MPAAIAVPAIISAASSVGSGLLGRSAAGNAANAQVASGQKAISGIDQARNQALGTAQGVYQTDQNALAPYMGVGTAALGQIGSAVLPADMGLNANSILQADPGYDFRMQQGQQAVERAAAANGSLGSGGALKAITQYGQDYASNEYGNTFNRLLESNQQRFGQLYNLANLGQNANGQLIGAGGNYANLAGQVGLGAAEKNAELLTGIGNAQASGYMGQANATSGMINSLGNIGASAYSQWKGGSPIPYGAYNKTGNAMPIGNYDYTGGQTLPNGDFQVNTKY